MNILVSGSSGFLGPYVLMEVEGNIETISLRSVDWNNLNLKRYDTIIHLAGKAHDMNALEDKEYFKINRDLTREFATRAKNDGVSQFVFVSTIKVYGEGGDQVITEQSEVSPQDAYAKSKMEAEDLLTSLDDPSFVVSILRPPLIYGDGVKGNLRNIIRLCKKLPFLPLGGINNKRSMVYAANVGSMINKIIIERRPGVYIPTDENPLSTTELVKNICECLGNRKWIPYIPILPSIVRIMKPRIYKRLYGNFVVDNSMSREALCWVPSYSIGEGIRDMVSNI